MDVYAGLDLKFWFAILSTTTPTRRRTRYTTVSRTPQVVLVSCE